MLKFGTEVWYAKYQVVSSGSRCSGGLQRQGHPKRVWTFLVRERIGWKWSSHHARSNMSVVGIARWGEVCHRYRHRCVSFATLRKWMSHRSKHFQLMAAFAVQSLFGCIDTFANVSSFRSVSAVVATTATTTAARGGVNKAYEGVRRVQAACVFVARIRRRGILRCTKVWSGSAWCNKHGRPDAGYPLRLQWYELVSTWRQAGVSFFVDVQRLNTDKIVEASLSVTYSGIFDVYVDECHR